MLIVWIIRILRDPDMPADHTPDDCWYLGSIYVNAQDPAIFVQWRIGWDFTINLGNRLAWLITGGFIAAMLGLIFALSR